jgi:PAS domain S-box-containing protein
MPIARIMVVEDERITAADLEASLEDLGYAVTAIAASGKQAIRGAETTLPDLVLMDIRIKGEMDGIDAAREIRQRFDIPVIYLTAHADDETLERAKSAEPLGYIVKPFQASELGAAIKMALHKHKVDKDAKQRQEQLSATLNTLGEGVITINGAGCVTYMNPAAETWTGWGLREALGKHIEEIFKIIDRESRRPSSEFVFRALRDGSVEQIPGSSLSVEISGASVLLSKDGMERPVGGTAAPVRDHLDRISGAVVAFGSVRFEDRVEQARPVAAFDGGKSQVIAESSTMRELMTFSRRIAASGVSAILLQGESGTGKDVIAKFLHRESPRRDSPFVAINCAAIPETLLESELFGYEKGAFTDARAQKKGVLDLADGGTVFLDEIGEIPLHLQAKLLRVLEEQSFRRLGGIKDVSVNVRIITATNKNLSEAVRQLEFREDLFYRLNVIQILIPPLREHKDDIAPLADFFVELYNRKFKRDIQGFSSEASERLANHNWPGNVRELRNCIERAMVLEESSWLQPASLAIGVENQPTSAPGRRLAFGRGGKKNAHARPGRYKRQSDPGGPQARDQPRYAALSDEEVPSQGIRGEHALTAAPHTIGH